MALSIVAQANVFANVHSPLRIYARNSGTVTREELVRLMAERNTTLTAADISACFRVYREVVTALLEDGKRVECVLSTFRMGASGEIETAMEEFTPGTGAKNHRLTLHTFADRKWAAELERNTAWQRAERFDESAPAIDTVLTVDGEGRSVAAGGMIHVLGRRLAFNKADAAQGVFFVDAAGARTRCSLYADVTASKVIAVVPQGIAAGEYAIVLVTRPAGRKPKTLEYEGSYTVTAA